MRLFICDKIFQMTLPCVLVQHSFLLSYHHFFLALFPLNLSLSFSMPQPLVYILLIRYLICNWNMQSQLSSRIQMSPFSFPTGKAANDLIFSSPWRLEPVLICATEFTSNFNLRGSLCMHSAAVTHHWFLFYFMKLSACITYNDNAVVQ